MFKKNNNQNKTQLELFRIHYNGLLISKKKHNWRYNHIPLAIGAFVLSYVCSGNPSLGTIAVSYLGLTLCALAGVDGDNIWKEKKHLLAHSSYNEQFKQEFMLLWQKTKGTLPKEKVLQGNRIMWLWQEGQLPEMEHVYALLSDMLTHEKKIMHVQGIVKSVGIKTKDSSLKYEQWL